MTWQDAKADARRRVELLTPLPPEPARLDGLTVVLVDYADAATFKFACSMNGWSHEYYRMVQRGVLRLLKKRGAAVEVRTIALADVCRWQTQTKSPPPQ